jgi:hypothetical protein
MLPWMNDLRPWASVRGHDRYRVFDADFWNVAVPEEEKKFDGRSLFASLCTEPPGA